MSLDLDSDSFFNIVFQSELDQVQSLCLLNKRFNHSCKYYKQHIAKHFLHKYKVNYKDPNNFIYAMNDIEYTTTRSYYDVLYLYMKFYKHKEIDASSKNITSIPILPNLVYLNCDNNQLKTLPELPRLVKLYCDNNQLSSIPSSPLLEFLSCNGNRNISIQQQDRLVKLYCDNTGITFDILNNVSPILEFLSCNGNQLTSIPLAFDSTLLELSCDNNLLGHIQEYPLLEFLSCANNQLSSLPELPTLIELICSNNQLTRIPEYPLLEFLACSNNQLEYLPNFPQLLELHCSNNPFRVDGIPIYPNLLVLID